jgi:hypothetical protein
MWFTVLLALSGLIAWLSYRKTGFHALMAIRFASLALLCYILTNPQWVSRTTDSIKQEWLVLVDESQSMESSASDINARLDELMDADTSHVRIQVIGFSGNVRPLSSTSDYNPNRIGTDIYRAFSESVDPLNPPDELILMSDGIGTTGRDPLALIEGFGVPVHVLAFGDTTLRKDVVLMDAGFPESAYLDTEIAVPVRITANGYEGNELVVRLLENGEEIDRMSLSVTSDPFFGNPVFRIRPQAEGQVRYEVRIDGLPDEQSLLNNRIRAAVRVESKRIRVLHAVYEIHPDIEAITSIYRSDPSVDVSMVRFNAIDTDSVDVLMIHGWPRNPDHIAALNTAMRRISSLIAPLPVTFSAWQGRFAGNRVVEKLITTIPTGIHPITDLPPVPIDRMPFVYGPLPDTTRGAFETRMSASTRGLILETSRSQNPRSAVLHAWGWFRLAQSPFQAEQDWNRTFFLNILDWLAVSETESRMRIDGLARQIRADEPLSFSVRLTNESGEPQDGSDVIIRLLGSDYRMEPAGAGLYQIRIPVVPEGFHSMTIEARSGDAVIASETRALESGASQIEFRRMRRDDVLLNAIAERSGGLSDWGDIKNRLSSAESIQIEREESILVARHPAWFILLLILLGTEWFWRRRVFLP